MEFFPPEFLTIIQSSAPYLSQFWKIVGAWWWAFLPFLLWPSFVNFYLFWRNYEYDRTVKKVFLEVKIPKEIKKSIKAMEYVFSGIHAVHDSASPKEKWIEGAFQHGFSLEIASIEGNIRFFIRCPESFRPVIETNIYSQYPEVEIIDAEDYTKKVPKDIPNKDWDIATGADMVLVKEDAYPIKTYIDFERESEIYEDRMIDPLSGLLEGMSTLGYGEQMWMQMVVKPVLDKDNKWVTKAQKVIRKITGRPEKPEPKPMIEEFFNILLGQGVEMPKEEKKEILPPEMKLTPGEREVLQNMERKISKVGYSAYIRFMYLGRRDSIFKPKSRIPYGYFKSLSNANSNGLKPEKTTMTRSKTIFTHFADKRLKYFKQRRMFLRYCARMSAKFPASAGHFAYTLSAEELATLYHFPSQGVVPAIGLGRIDSKKGEAPARLPIE